MKPHKVWTPDELALLSKMYPDTQTQQLAERLGRKRTAIYAKAYELGLKKSQAFLDSPASGRLVGNDERGNAGRFHAGQTPWNKGMKGFKPKGRSHETQFKPGYRGGVAARRYQPVGAERIVDGYRQRKVNNDLPLHRRWRSVHVLLWEEHNGPVPDGHALIFINGDRADIRLDNLQLISRRELMSRNTVHRLPKELADVCQLKGAVQRQINRRLKHREEQD